MSRPISAAACCACRPAICSNPPRPIRRRTGATSSALLGVALADAVPCFLPGAPGSFQPNAACPPLSQGSLLNAVYIEGHTDAAPLRGGADRFRDNWDLSAARSIDAYRIVRDSDPRVPNLKNAEGKSLIGVSGYADTRPADRWAERKAAQRKGGDGDRPPHRSQADHGGQSRSGRKSPARPEPAAGRPRCRGK